MNSRGRRTSNRRKAREYDNKVAKQAQLSDAERKKHQQDLARAIAGRKKK